MKAGCEVLRVGVEREKGREKRRENKKRSKKRSYLMRRKKS